MIMKKYPDKIARIFNKHNDTLISDNQVDFNANANIKTNYINDALCKMSKSIFFDQKISYCSSNDVNKSIKKK